MTDVELMLVSVLRVNSLSLMIKFGQGQTIKVPFAQAGATPAIPKHEFRMTDATLKWLLISTGNERHCTWRDYGHGCHNFRYPSLGRSCFGTPFQERPFHFLHSRAVKLV